MPLFFNFHPAAISVQVPKSAFLDVAVKMPLANMEGEFSLTFSLFLSSTDFYILLRYCVFFIIIKYRAGFIKLRTVTGVRSWYGQNPDSVIWLGLWWIQAVFSNCSCGLAWSSVVRVRIKWLDSALLGCPLCSHRENVSSKSNAVFIRPKGLSVDHMIQFFQVS